MGPEGIPERRPTRGKDTDRFHAQKTKVPYAYFRTEPRVRIEMSLTTLAGLLEIATKYHTADRQKKAIEGEQAVRHKEIEGIAQEYPGLRGVIDEQGKLVLTVYPQERDVSWDEELLRKGLGPLFGDVVDKRYSFEIPARLMSPTGEVDADQILVAIKEAVAHAFGLPEEDVVRTLKVEPKLDVNEKRLLELEARGRATIPKGTRTIGKIVWTVTTDELKP